MAKDFGDTSYRSQVSRKYSGITYGGQPAVLNRTPAGDLANALKTEATPFMEAYAKTSIQGKQDVAVDKLNQLRLSGKSADDIHQEIMSGQHPALNSMYAQAAIDGQQGRYIAADTIAKLKAKKQDYDAGLFRSQSLEEFIAQSGVLPDFNNMSSSMTKGYATTFSDWFENEKLVDADMRAGVAQNDKLGQIGFVFREHNKTHPNLTFQQQYNFLKTFQSEYPNPDGSAGNYVTNDEINVLLEEEAEYAAQTCKDTVCIQKGIDLLIGDRGDTKDGTALGSLLDAKGTDPSSTVPATYAALLAKQKALEDEELTNVTKERNRNLIKIYTAISETLIQNKKDRPDSDGALDTNQRAGIIEMAHEFGLSDKIGVINTALDNANGVGIDTEEMNVLMGNLRDMSTLEEVMDAARDMGANSADMVTVISLWNKINTGSMFMDTNGTAKNMSKAVIPNKAKVGARIVEILRENGIDKDLDSILHRINSEGGKAEHILGEIRLDLRLHMEDWRSLQKDTPSNAEIGAEVKRFLEESLRDRINSTDIKSQSQIYYTPIYGTASSSPDLTEAEIMFPEASEKEQLDRLAAQKAEVTDTAQDSATAALGGVSEIMKPKDEEEEAAEYSKVITDTAKLYGVKEGELPEKREDLPFTEAPKQFKDTGYRYVANMFNTLAMNMRDALAETGTDEQQERKAKRWLENPENLLDDLIDEMTTRVQVGNARNFIKNLVPVLAHFDPRGKWAKKSSTLDEKTFLLAVKKRFVMEVIDEIG